MKNLTYLILLLLAINSGCDFMYVDDNQFIGTWELKGRSSIEGMQVEIFKEDGKLRGKIVKLSDSDLAKMFAKEGDIWVKEIKRTSNFQFFLTESKIAAKLFAMYDIKTSTKFKAQFINENKIGLSEKNGDPKNSKIYYERIK